MFKDMRVPDLGLPLPSNLTPVGYGVGRQYQGVDSVNDAVTVARRRVIAEVFHASPNGRLLLGFEPSDRGVQPQSPFAVSNDVRLAELTPNPQIDAMTRQFGTPFDGGYSQLLTYLDRPLVAQRAYNAPRIFGGRSVGNQ